MKRHPRPLLKWILQALAGGQPTGDLVVGLNIKKECKKHSLAAQLQELKHGFQT